MTGALVLNGEYYYGDIEGDIVVCCDGGFDKSDRCDVLIGDMDSIRSLIAEKELNAKGIEVVNLDRDKDFTDGEAGLNYLLDKGVKDITIYGLDGGRLDHIIGNIGLMSYALEKGANSVVARCNNFTAYMLDKPTEINVEIGYTISISPFTDYVHIIKTKGLKYAINDGILKKNSSLSYSNLSTEKVVAIGVERGQCLVIVNNKE